MQKLFLLSGAISGALAVGIGAFGAHALKATLQAAGRLDVYETAVKYQFYHALALVLTGILAFRIEDKLLNYSGYSFLAGTIIFSGSLYILCLSGVSKWGAVTPFGGLLLIAGWILLFAAISRGL